MLKYEGLTHKATLIMIPYRKDIWLNGGKDAIETIYDMAKVITKYEHLYLICHDDIIDYTKNRFKDLANITYLNINYNDAWARDICPLFGVKNNELIAINFDFNAWGGSYDGLYQDYELDRQVKDKLCNILNISSIDIPFILEGGSINYDGKGTLITTEACLLSKGRNPEYSKKEIEQILKNTLEIDKVIWLKHGIVEDETNEHVDNMAQFLDSKTIALAWSDKGLQHQYSKEAKDYLESLGYKVILLPVPNPDLYLTSEEANQININENAKTRLANSKLAASYINFYQAKYYLLLPQFGVKEDEIAYNILNDYYKGSKTIYKINSRSILVSGGNIHCITMQIPEVNNES